MLLALTNIPSYKISWDSAAAFDQKGGDSIRKFRTTPLVAFHKVSEMGRPSPSARVRVAKKDHQGYRIENHVDGTQVTSRSLATYLSVPLDASSVVRINNEVGTGDDEPRCLALGLTLN